MCGWHLLYWACCHGLTTDTTRAVTICYYLLLRFGYVDVISIERVTMVMIQATST